eukprot:1787415-Prymnesium_polylepis.1
MSSGLCVHSDSRTVHAQTHIGCNRIALGRPSGRPLQASAPWSLPPCLWPVQPFEKPAHNMTASRVDCLRSGASLPTPAGRQHGRGVTPGRYPGSNKHASSG